MRRFVVGVCCLAVIGLSATGQARRPQFPTTVEVEGKLLRLNGQATLRKWFFSIYDVGLYLEAPTRDPRHALSQPGAKRLHLRLRRDAPRDQLVNLLRWRLQTVAGKDYPSLEPRVIRLLDAIPAAKAGQSLIITWHPQRGTALAAPETPELLIPGKDFADALFNVWLQDDRIFPGLMGN